MGYYNCSRACIITELSALASLQTVRGSLSIQCCNSLIDIAGLRSLRRVEGTLRIRYNLALERVSAQSPLQGIKNIDISQNQNLQAITGFENLIQLDGYLVISRNPALTILTGFRSLALITGGESSGQALSVLYNTALTDLSGLRSLRAVGIGTVHIEGNTRLCFAGHPMWRYGSYPSRPSEGDQGIDWRTVLSSAPLWQYTWNVSGIPTLLIQNNGDQTTCRESANVASISNIICLSFSLFRDDSLSQLMQSGSWVLGTRQWTVWHWLLCAG